MADLRPYQTEAIAAVREHFRNGVRSVLVVAATGAGKGTIIASILASTAAKGRRGLFVVHRSELVRDIAARIVAAGVPSVGVEMADETERNGSLVTVGTVQSLAAREWGEDVDLIVIDEAHRATAATYRALLARCPGARVVGFTATPQRGDGTALGDVFQALVLAATPADLVRDGYLVSCEVVAPPARKATLALSPVDAHREYAKGPAIVFCKSVAHAQREAEAFRAAGVTAESVEGKLDDAERARRFARFASGETAVLTNCQLVTEGYDIPAVQCIILASGSAHAGAFLQKVGRARRPSPGKTHATIVDLVGSVWDCGLPDEERTYSLKGKPISVQGDTDELALRSCLECGRIGRAARWGEYGCPFCGYVSPGKPDPKVVAAEMQVVKDAKRAQIVARQMTAESVALLRERGRKGFARVMNRWPWREELVAAGMAAP